MTRCPVRFADLADYAEGISSPVDRERVRLHLETGCRRCRENLAFLSAGPAALRDALAPTLPSEPARAFVRALGAAPPTAPRSWIATLLFDGVGAPQPAGARGPAGPGGQRLYGTEAHLVTLWQERTERGDWYVIGQIYDRTEGVCQRPETVLAIDESGGAHAATLRDGEFHTQLAPGAWQFHCWIEDATLVLSRVVIGAEA